MKNKLFYLLPILLSSICITSCGFISFDKDEHKDLTPLVIEKTKIQQSNSDLYHHSGYTNIATCPSSGEVKALIIPIWFKNSSDIIPIEYRENVRSDINATYLGSKEETGWNSVASYYYEESFGKFSLTGVTSEWYECDNNYAYYGNDDEYSSRTSTLINDAVNWYFSSTMDNRLDYDLDKDGYLDAVILIYAAPDSQQVGFEDYSNFWAYTYWSFLKNNPSKPVQNAYFWASYDFIYGDNAFERSGNTYAHGDTDYTILDSHCFIHEMGHVLGLPDYYDYSDYSYTPAGGFSMQDYNIGGHEPHSLMTFNWADPYIPTESGEITIKDFQSSHDFILLTPEFNDKNSPFDEYMILELYTPTGLNQLDSTYAYSDYVKGPNLVGIRLWHVDARLLSYRGYFGSFTSDATSRNVYLAFSNSYDSEDVVAGPEYVNYNVLQLIRNDKYITYQPTDFLSNSSLFFAGNTYKQSEFNRQFVKGNKLNNGKYLGWSFKVKNIQKENDGSFSSTIELFKE